MKKIILLMLLPFIMEGQITGVEKSEEPTEVKIGKAKRSDFDIINLRCFVKGSDSTFVLDYYNQKYTTLKDRKYIYFTGGSKTVNDLYNLLSSFYSEANIENKEMKLDFKLGKTSVSVSRMKKEIMVWTNEGYFILSKGNIESLFKK